MRMNFSLQDPLYSARWLGPRLRRGPESMTSYVLIRSSLSSDPIAGLSSWGIAARPHGHCLKLPVRCCFVNCPPLPHLLHSDGMHGHCMGSLSPLVSQPWPVGFGTSGENNQFLLMSPATQQLCSHAGTTVNCTTRTSDKQRVWEVRTKSSRLRSAWTHSSATICTGSVVSRPLAIPVVCVQHNAPFSFLALPVNRIIFLLSQHRTRLVCHLSSLKAHTTIPALTGHAMGLAVRLTLLVARRQPTNSFKPRGPANLIALTAISRLAW